MKDGSPNIVVTDGYTLNPGDNPWDELEALGRVTVYDRTPPDQTVPRCAVAEIVLTNKVWFRREVIDRLPRLRYIGVTATGFDNVDLEAAAARGIPVTNVPEYGTYSVAQFVFALLLELCHHVGLHAEAVRDGEWSTSPDFSFWKVPTDELHGKTMSVIGFGRIGRRVGEIAHAMGMGVLGNDIRTIEPPEYVPFSWVTKEEAFSRADVVSLNCSLSPDIVRMVDRRRLSLMKREALLINTARGALVDEKALSEALNSGRLAGAGLDVVSTEPIRTDNPLLGAKNCLITPHIAWSSLQSRRRLMKVVVDNVRSFLDGERENRVNL